MGVHSAAPRTKKYRGSIKENSVIHEHNTRRKNDLHIQPCRTSLFQKSVINIGIKLFNHLSTELKQLDDFNQFKKEVKKILMEQTIVYT